MPTLRKSVMVAWAEMDCITRAASPFRFSIPEYLVPELRGLRASQQDWRPLIDQEDVVHLFYGMGPALFLAFDGRVLVDPIAWDDSDAYEVEATNPLEAWSAIVVGAVSMKFPELLRLLPPRPLNARDCPSCRGTGWWSWMDTAGNIEPQCVCWSGCGGLGWRLE